MRRRASTINAPTSWPAVYVRTPYHVAVNNVLPYRLALHAVLQQRQFTTFTKEQHEITESAAVACKQAITSTMGRLGIAEPPGFLYLVAQR